MDIFHIIHNYVAVNNFGTHAMKNDRIRRGTQQWYFIILCTFSL